MLSDLIEKLKATARTTRLLVACDYDGTLAELVSDPSKATPSTRAISALRTLSRMDGVSTAVVSGRALKDLDTFLGIGGPEIRIGSHGAEWPSHGIALTSNQDSLLKHLARAVSSLAEESAGLLCEMKPAGVALHVRGVRPHVARMVVESAVVALGGLPGVYVRQGCEVIEFMVVPANKGTSVLGLRQAAGATAIVFIGDDLTDEDVFAVLSRQDVGIKVGHQGETAATFRVNGPEAVAAVLEELALQRAEWVKYRSNLP